MQRASIFREADPVSEMAIVDTFTKLIFGEEDDYSPRELLIIQALRAVDADALGDTYGDIGEYLRDLGVREMIQLVSLLREQMLGGIEALVSGAGPVVPLESAHHPVMNRRAH